MMAAGALAAVVAVAILRPSAGLDSDSPGAQLGAFEAYVPDETEEIYHKVVEDLSYLESAFADGSWYVEEETGLGRALQGVDGAGSEVGADDWS